MPTSADVLAILDRIVRRIAHRLADEARGDSVEQGVDVLAQVQDSAIARALLARLGLPCTPVTFRAGPGPTAGRVLVRRRVARHDRRRARQGPVYADVDATYAR